MSPDVQAQLAQLRDIRMPQEIGLWPLAPGWWALMLVIVCALVALFSWRLLRRRGTRYLALKELEVLSDDDRHQFAAQLSMLMHRVARRKDASTAQLSGRRWAEYLSGSGLALQHANYLAEAPYTRQSEDATGGADLRHAVENWIRRQT